MKPYGNPSHKPKPASKAGKTGRRRAKVARVAIDRAARKAERQSAKVQP